MTKIKRISGRSFLVIDEENEHFVIPIDQIQLIYPHGNTIGCAHTVVRIKLFGESDDRVFRREPVMSQLRAIFGA